MVVLSGHSEEKANEPYDVMDGTGPSRKKVDVVEWEKNLEIHVYPKGSLAGLTLKLDETSKDRKVMVIGYQFDNNPGKTQIRRNILGIPFHKNFKTYKDLSAEDYDKIIISPSSLKTTGKLIAYQTKPAPAQNYPDEYYAQTGIEKKEERQISSVNSNNPKSEQNSSSNPVQIENFSEKKKNLDEDTGTIRFSW
jgi:hypothetical protein